MYAIPHSTSSTVASNDASLLPPLEWHWAEVQEVIEGRLRLALPACAGVFEARSANGLLLQPRQGDTVLAARREGEWFVLMVVQRQQAAAPAVLAVPGAAALRIESPGLTLATRDLDVRAQRTTASLGVVRLSAQALRMAAQRIAVWADSLHTRARAVSLRADMRTARVDGSDVLHAEKLLTEVDDVVRLDGRQIQVRATENVLINGKRISLG